MKTIWRLALLTILLSSPLTVRGQTIELAGPVPYFDEHEEQGGLVTSIVTSAFKSQEIFVHIEISEIDSNSINKLTVVLETEAKKSSDRVYSNSILINPTILLVNRYRSVEVNAKEDIVNYRIGVTEDTNYCDEYKKLQKGADLLWAKNDHESMQQLLHSKIDVLPISFYKGTYLLNKHFTSLEHSKFEFILYPNVCEENFYLVCNKQDLNCLDTIKAFNKGLKEISTNGKRNEIVRDFLSGR